MWGRWDWLGGRTRETQTKERASFGRHTEERGEVLKGTGGREGGLTAEFHLVFPPSGMKPKLPLP